MWRSPLYISSEQLGRTLRELADGSIVCEIRQETHLDVDIDELIKALQLYREMQEKGVAITMCKDCKYHSSRTGICYHPSIILLTAQLKTPPTFYCAEGKPK